MEQKNALNVKSILYISFMLVLSNILYFEY